MKNKFNFLKIILSLTIATLLLFSSNVFANDEINIINKSEEFEKWENLPKEERNNTIQPQFFNVTYKDSVKRSVYNKYTQSLKSSVAQKYNLKDIIDINVKDQKYTNSCWAFSYSSVLETVMANKYKSSKNYSPMHIEYVASSMFNKTIIEGGNGHLALAYSNSGNGPVYEDDFPFTSVYDEEKNADANYYLSDISSVNTDIKGDSIVDDATIFAGIYKTYTDETIKYGDSSTYTESTAYSEEEVESIRTQIKEHIKNYGAVTTTMYSDLKIDSSGNVTSTGDYFNSATNSFYCNTTLKTANHAVTIVGWDDTFSKENFNQEHQPINDGAYIILNSYGSDILDNGYMYISYDDAFIEQDVIGVNTINSYSEEDDYIYQHDELGMSAVLPFTDDGTYYITSGYMANVFKRDSSKTEYLNEVGIYLNKTEGIEVYVNAESDDKNSLTKVASYTGDNAIEAGYHKIAFANSVKLTGDKFIVAIRYINTEGAEAPIECDLYKTGLSEVSTFFDNAESSPDESFTSTDGATWQDLDNLNYYGIITLKDTNACIKAFTTSIQKYDSTTVSVTGVTLDKTSYTMQIGDTANLVATISPTNATNQNVTWSSSDETIAKVSENGIITAIATGTTEITVKTEDGDYTATCKLTVEEDEENENDIYTVDEENENTNSSTTNTISATDTSSTSTTDTSSTSTTETDTTVATTSLPATGLYKIIGTMVLIIAVGGFAFYRYKNIDK